LVEAIPDGVFLAGMILVLLLVSLMLSTPLALVAGWRYIKTRRSVHKTALIFSALNAVGQGLSVGMLGFVFVAGIGDEQAGEALVPLVAGGFIGGVIIAFLPSYLLILLTCKIGDRLASPRV
jgi:hypothetical protein